MLYGLTQEFHKEQGQQNRLKGDRSFGGADAHSRGRIRTMSFIALCTAALVGCGGGGSPTDADVSATGVRATAPGQLRHQENNKWTDPVVTDPVTTDPVITDPVTTDPV